LVEVAGTGKNQCAGAVQTVVRELCRRVSCAGA